MFYIIFLIIPFYDLFLWITLPLHYKFHNNMNPEEHTKTMLLLEEAHKAWSEMQEIRSKRDRNKDFTYGNQWRDKMKNDDGIVVTEREWMKSQGREPYTNNLIRQLVKSVVGRFRSKIADESDSNTDLNELDSRSLEEFLISGCCFQRITSPQKVDIVSPERMFLRIGTDPLGRDCTMIGMLHDMPLAEVVKRFNGGNRDKALDICHIYNDNDAHGSGSFFTPSLPARVRVIEMWKQVHIEGYDCHDRATGDWYFQEGGNSKPLSDSVERRWTMLSHWQCYWLTPDGSLLSSYSSPYAHAAHPFVFKLYPYTDGEVHSLVEDIIDQQKHINRLITLVDNIMSISAKGVLLYPDNILPHGYTWKDLRDAWARPNAIIPYHPHYASGGGDLPQQISTNATGIGAYEMVNLQMNLFEKISGVNSALQGQAEKNAGAQLYESQIANATISLADIFETFNNFRLNRNNKIAQSSITQDFIH